MTRTLLHRILGFWVLFGLYLLLVGTLETDELAAGLAVALLASLASRALRAHSRRRHAIRPGWLLRLASLPAKVVTESATVLRAAVRPVPPQGLGRTLTIPFLSETGLSPEHDAGRRALVVAALCATPNAYVVLRQRDADAPGRQPAGGSLVIHQLVPGDPPGRGDPSWPL